MGIPNDADSALVALSLPEGPDRTQDTYLDGHMHTEDQIVCSLESGSYMQDKEEAEYKSISAVSFYQRPSLSLPDVMRNSGVSFVTLTRLGESSWYFPPLVTGICQTC